MYHSQKQFAKAELLLVKVLEVSRRVLGEEHPFTLNSMNNVGVAYQNVGKFDKALTLHEQILEKRKLQLGPDHPRRGGELEQDHRPTGRRH